jgi:hypothetical protein
VTFRYLAAPGPLELTFGVRLWAFEPGHSKLLLRGFSDPESEDGQTIVDVVFSNVTRMRLDAGYPGLMVRVAEESDAIPQAEIGRTFTDDKVYAVNPGPRYGFVVAERVDWATLDIQGHEPSPLLAEDTARLTDVAVGDIYWL